MAPSAYAFGAHAATQIIINDKPTLDALIRRRYCLVPLHARPDGDCLYTAVGHASLGGPTVEGHAELLRHLATSYFDTASEEEKVLVGVPDAGHPDESKWKSASTSSGSASAYLHNMRKRGEWGGYLEMHALSKQIKRRFVVFYYNNDKKDISTMEYPGGNGPTAYFLLWRGHYEHLVPDTREDCDGWQVSFVSFGE